MYSRLESFVDLCRILVGGSLSVPCSLPGPPVVSVFSPLRPGKGGWSLASQRWLEVNDLGRLVNRYGRRQWHPTPVQGKTRIFFFFFLEKLVTCEAYALHKEFLGDF